MNDDKNMNQTNSDTLVPLHSSDLLDKKYIKIEPYFHGLLPIVVRMNALYFVLKDRGLINDDELKTARQKSIDILYEEITAKQKLSANKIQGLDKSNPWTWWRILFAPISKIRFLFREGQ